MNSTTRREKINQILSQSTSPVSASYLAGQLDVSRQVIVGDIALLRAAGAEIFATPRGYVLKDSQNINKDLLRKIACKHKGTDMAEEIYTIIDNGGALIDVIVEHSIYGQITGSLQIYSRFDAQEFIKKTEENQAQPLSLLTDGVHLHTVSCKDEETYDRIIKALKDKGFLFEK